MKRIIIAVMCSLLLGMTACSKTNNEWDSASDFGEIQEVTDIQEITDDFAERTELDEVLAVDKLHETIHYASLDTLFTDAYNKTLLEHQTPLRQVGFWHSKETTEETGRYNFASNGIMFVKAENEKIFNAEFTTSLEMTPEERAAYAVNLIYHIIPNVTKKDLTHIYQSILTWKEQELPTPPSLTRGNYTVMFSDSLQGFVMKIGLVSE